MGRLETVGSMKKRAYLSLGSNTGDRATNLHEAIDRLSQVGNVAAVSSFYETEPVEFTSQPWFLNCAVAIDTDKAPIQAAMDKVRSAAKGDDVNAIRQAIGELEQASHAMAQHLYKSGGEGGGPGAAGPSGDGRGGPSDRGGGKDDVIDAEFEVKK